MQIESLLEETARCMPERTALICGARSLTYAELEADANRLAHALIAEGLERGDRVAICLGNCLESAVAVYAVLKAGGVFMMINPTVKPRKLAYLLDHSGARLLALPARKVAAMEPAFGGAPDLKAVIVTGTNCPVEVPSVKPLVPWEALLERHANDGRPPEKRAIDVDLASLNYTSGSTGSPKGVMMTHRNTLSVVRSVNTYLGNTADDVILDVLPLSFSYGLDQLFLAAAVGACVVIEPSLAYPHAVLKRAVGHGVTAFPLVPTIAAMLLGMDLESYDLSRLRYLTNAGAAISIEHIRQLRRRLPHVKIVSMYGQTECKRASYLPPEEIDRRPGSVGRGMPNEEVTIIDEEGRPVGPGEVGQLVVRGSNVMQGYWAMPEETERALRPGPIPGQRVLYTGDLFRMDEEGYLYFVARKDDIIKTRGEKVSPKEVEDALYAMPQVAEAAVVGVPDPMLGQAVRALVVAKAGVELTRQDVLRHCAEQLEDFMVPQSIEFLASLPKNDNGKIDKRSLAAGDSVPGASK